MKLRNFETKRTLKRKNKEAEETIRFLRRKIENLQFDLEMEKSLSKSYKDENKKLNKILDKILGASKDVEKKTAESCNSQTV